MWSQLSFSSHGAWENSKIRSVMVVHVVTSPKEYVLDAFFSGYAALPVTLPGFRRSLVQFSQLQLFNIALCLSED